MYNSEDDKIFSLFESVGIGATEEPVTVTGLNLLKLLKNIENTL